MPRPGRIQRYREPAGPGVRVDSGFAAGDEISPAYDSLIAKLIVWGPDRETARHRMLRALSEYEIEGLATTIPAHQLLLEHTEFVDGSYSTRTVEGGAMDSLKPAKIIRPPDTRSSAPPAQPEIATAQPHEAEVTEPKARLWHPAIAAAVGAPAAPTREGNGDRLRGRTQLPAPAPDSGTVVAPMHGTILKVLVNEGDSVAAGDLVAVLEAMKMETQVAATRTGVVREVRVQPGAIVEAGEAVAIIAAADE
jgi:acetyl-CoA/propionyl-CoA carboxylase biotin carboxyl carrier protein